MKSNIHHIEKKFLQEEYIKNFRSLKSIAKELGCSPMYVRKWMIQYGITTRTQSQYKRELNWRTRMSIAKKRDGHWQGKSNPNWRGGISSVIHGERASGSVKSWRHWVKVRDDFICQLCGIDGKIPCKCCGHKPRLHADHIKPWSEYPHLRFEISNGRTLCEDCHIRKKSSELLEHLTVKDEGNQQPRQI
jgi:5-methylcytosine-specific restriction endonuclease McrA